VEVARQGRPVGIWAIYEPRQACRAGCRVGVAFSSYAVVVRLPGSWLRWLAPATQWPMSSSAAIPTQNQSGFLDRPEWRVRSCAVGGKLHRHTADRHHL
jgi:hypothetical protein